MPRLVSENYAPTKENTFAHGWNVGCGYGKMPSGLQSRDFNLGLNAAREARRGGEKVEPYNGGK